MSAIESGSAPPSPLTVGKHFVKQYYNVLQTTSDQIFRFYQPSSLLSHAEGSSPTDPSSLEGYEIAGRWGIIGNESKGFAIEIGAIDAQPSSNGSILLVVTGTYSSTSKDPRKTFIHTFFLSYIPNTKRFYVANDVLRFLEKAGTTKEGVEEPEKPLEEAPVVEVTPAPIVVVDQVDVVSAAEETSPGGGVEESKEEVFEEEEEAVVPPAEIAIVESEVTAEQAPAPVETKKEAAAPKAEKDGGKGKRGKGKSGQNATKQQPAASKPTTGSWASVASRPAAVSPPVPPSPSRPAPAEKPEPEKAPPPSPARQEKETTPKETGRGGGGTANRGDRPKRDPDCTLVIKGLPDGTKDSELLALFEGFAASTGGKILGTTVSAHRGLGFVDFDSVPPVLAVVAKHQESPLELHGRALEVDQKTAEQRARRNVRGGYTRNGSPGNGGAYRAGGGRGQYRGRGGGGNGRGDRGGGRGRGGK